MIPDANCYPGFSKSSLSSFGAGWGRGDQVVQASSASTPESGRMQHTKPWLSPTAAKSLFPKSKVVSTCILAPKVAVKSRVRFCNWSHLLSPKDFIGSFTSSLWDWSAK
ncbi:hypothetical protein MGN70_014727 [Eutypa lata]|nr:hypothetical protein MGN70_014727 [Eutypa lata]